MKLVLADVDRELAKVAEECENILGVGSGSVVYQFADVSDYQQVKALATLAIAHFGEVNLLMNNAAIQTNGQCSPCDPAHRDRFEKIIKVNLWGVVNMCQAFIPYVQLLRPRKDRERIFLQQPNQRSHQLYDSPGTCSSKTAPPSSSTPVPSKGSRARQATPRTMSQRLGSRCIRSNCSTSCATRRVARSML